MLHRLLLYFAFLLVLCAPAGSAAQTSQIDSLKRQLQKTSNPSGRLQLLFALCNERQSLHTDTMHTYATAALSLARQKKDTLLEARAVNCLCHVLIKKALIDSVVTESNRQISRLQNSNAPRWLINEFIYLKGMAYVRNNRFKEALAEFLQLLNNAETIKDVAMQVRAKTGVGWVYMEMNQNRNAIRWLRQAIATTNDKEFLSKYGSTYSNLAGVYINMGRMDSATYFINISLEGARRYQVLANLANALYIQADIFMAAKNSKAAEASLKEALQVRRRIGDPFYIVSDMAQLASFYATIGQHYEGINVARQGIDIANQYRMEEKLLLLYGALGQNLKMLGDYKAYSEVQEKILALKDSIYQKNSAEELASLQAQYNLQRHQNIIIQQKLDLVEKNYWLYGLITLFAMVLLFIAVQIINYRKRQKLLMEKLLKEQQQKEIIAILKAEEKERKRIAADLHDNLGAYAAAISADVNILKSENPYNSPLTQRIENNVGSMVNQLGNTIWVLNKQSRLLTDLSDRFKVWMQKLMDSYPGVAYDFEELITDDIDLSPAWALHLFYMMQECVTNALKHSQCTHILICILGEAQKFQIEITDNGKGFNPEQLCIGNGIQNLKQRALLCNLSVQWFPAPAGGTMVQISSN